MATWLIDLITGGGILVIGGSVALYIRKRVCRCCLGTGVVMSQECTCGATRDGWAIAPHEATCGTWPCPNGCKIVPTRGEAIAVWRRHWELTGGAR